MTREQYDLLKKVLSIQTVTGQEGRMVQFLCEYFTEKGYDFYLDHKNNVYVQKGTAEIYPCVMSHTDTVHHMRQQLQVVEALNKRPNNFGQTYNDQNKRLVLTGVNQFGQPSGIGGDDKCGIYVCLRLLESFTAIKAAFFVSEETGCWGSREADPNFFTNVGYAIQFDAPGDRLVTEFCSGVQLFERNSDFFALVQQALVPYGPFLYQQHPYTDICQIKQKFPISCLNISCGYYRMHSPSEFVDVEDVMRSVDIGAALLHSLGLQRYEYEYIEPPPPPVYKGKRFNFHPDLNRELNVGDDWEELIRLLQDEEAEEDEDEDWEAQWDDEGEEDDDKDLPHPDETFGKN